MLAILRSLDEAAVTTPSPFGIGIRHLLQGLRRTLDRLVPPYPAGEGELPPEFYRFPPF